MGIYFLNLVYGLNKVSGSISGSVSISHPFTPGVVVQTFDVWGDVTGLSSTTSIKESDML